MNKTLKITFSIALIAMIFIGGFYFYNIVFSQENSNQEGLNQESIQKGLSEELVCSPQTCSSLGVECESIDDGCGKEVYCGYCDLSEKCIEGRCVVACDNGIPRGSDQECGYCSEGGPHCDSNAELKCVNNLCVYDFPCGDGICNGDETKSSCPEDCGKLIVIDADIQRNAPSVVVSGETFQIEYIANIDYEKWGATIEDNISGGCALSSGKTTLKSVMLSTAGKSQIIEVTAPSSSGSCTFSGDYNFIVSEGSTNLINFNSLTVTIQ